MTKIYIDVPKSETLEEFIINCFDTENKSYGDEIYKYCKETFFDHNFNNLQCKTGRRSFEDLLNIVNTNFNSELTAEELAICLYKMWCDKLILSLFCPDIEKLVFYRYTGYKKCKYKLCEDGLNPEDNDNLIDIDYAGNSEYSLKEILDLAGQKDNYEIE